MKIEDIPQEIYMVALDYENLERPKNLEDAQDWYNIDTGKKGFTNGGIEKAIADYLLHQNAFGEKGEFFGVADNGWGVVNNNGALKVCDP